MKKQSLVIIGAMLISLLACQKEDVTEEVVHPEAILEGQDTDIQTKASGEFCRFTLQFNAKSVLDPVTGKQICQFDPGNICAIVECIPDPNIIFELPPIIWDPCQIVPCGLDFIDPWILTERIDPREFRSFKDFYELKLDQRTQAIPFAMNENLLGIQFYQQPQPQPSIYGNEILQEDGMVESGIFYLENKIVLEHEVAKKLGLRGNVIKPGKYPIVFNKENKTHNLLVVVENGF
ncbi:hypothetical protein [Aquimarina sp. 2201CG14-23]|uniref:hypothetical protein n=1 Tax=Aquimarina mycalae TaxID=3040073 RepID=UPI002477FF25|nr:hypothetical protein [Aquimarina sp. 2201CG14-23]MDH7447346.1 hypothetical protein [Aquimarina sp. 2201CG14-23]